MPWCETCDRFLTPNTVREDGTCPSCGRPVERAATTTGRPAGDDEEQVRAPWHFWVLVVGVVGYLAWRLVQGVGWATGWF